jgi:hypothetical protein
MRKLFAAVAISALALTSAAPMVQAAERIGGVYKAENPSLHQVAQKKKAKSTKGSKRKAPMKTSQKKAPVKQGVRRA